MLKLLYFTVTILYFLFFMVYLCSPTVIYLLLKVDPDIIEIRSLTNEEFKTLKYAARITQQIVIWFLRASFLVCIISGVIFYFDLLQMKSFVKFVLIFSLIATLILFVATNINFIPLPPIR